MTATGFAILVGGRSSRMGGEPKGLLKHNGRTLVERQVELARSLGCDPFLVGNIDAYDSIAIGVTRIPDVPNVEGPLSGLLAALRAKTGELVLVSCDLPFLTKECVEGLDRTAAVSAYRQDDGLWEPFPSYFSAGALAEVEARVTAGDRSFQRVLSHLASPVPIEPAMKRCFHDWDEPSDLEP